ncbi:MAG: hypothetical protein LWY06_00760 [Firmicutes bacterium]|nr:hypothetical protein [Bacillota bacterium]
MNTIGGQTSAQINHSFVQNKASQTYMANPKEDWQPFADMVETNGTGDEKQLVGLVNRLCARVEGSSEAVGGRIGKLMAPFEDRIKLVLKIQCVNALGKGISGPLGGIISNIAGDVVSENLDGRFVKITEKNMMKTSQGLQVGRETLDILRETGTPNQKIMAEALQRAIDKPAANITTDDFSKIQASFLSDVSSGAVEKPLGEYLAEKWKNDKNAFMYIDGELLLKAASSAPSAEKIVWEAAAKALKGNESSQGGINNAFLLKKSVFEALEKKSGNSGEKLRYMTMIFNMESHTCLEFKNLDEKKKIIEMFTSLTDGLSENVSDRNKSVVIGVNRDILKMAENGNEGFVDQALKLTTSGGFIDPKSTYPSVEWRLADTGLNFLKDAQNCGESNSIAVAQKVLKAISENAGLKENAEIAAKALKTERTKTRALKSALFLDTGNNKHQIGEYTKALEKIAKNVLVYEEAVSSLPVDSLLHGDKGKNAESKTIKLSDDTVSIGGIKLKRNKKSGK